MNKLTAVLTVAMCAAVAQASVTLNLGGGTYEDSSGNPLFTYIEDGHLFMLLGDPSGDGFQSLGSIQNNTSFLAGDDVLIDHWGANVWATAIEGQLGHSVGGYEMLGNGLAKDDSLCLIWFESIKYSDVSSAPAAFVAETPGSGEHYGYHQEWLLPADSATVNLDFVSSGTSGRASHQTAGGVAPAATQITAPERDLQDGPPLETAVIGPYGDGQVGGFFGIQLSGDGAGGDPNYRWSISGGPELLPDTLLAELPDTNLDGSIDDYFLTFAQLAGVGAMDRAATAPYTLRLDALDGAGAPIAGSGSEIQLLIPEPTSLMLLVFGGGVIAARRRRRHSA